MATVTVVTSHGFTPFCIEVPEGKERSVKGALHVKPNSTLEITEDELEAVRQDMPAGLTFVIHRPAPVVAVPQPVEDEGPATEDAASDDEEPKPRAKSKTKA